MASREPKYTIAFLRVTGEERQRGQHPSFSNYKKAKAYARELNAGALFGGRFGRYVVIVL